MHETNQEVVSAIAREIAAQIGKGRFDLWFRDSTQLRLNGNVLTIGVPNQFFQGWLQTNFGEAVSQAAAGVAGCPVTVRFEVNGRMTPSREPDPPAHYSPNYSPKPAPANGRDEQSASRLAALEDFVTGPCNQLAHAAAQQVCQSPGRQLSPLVLYGAVGLGKTHLLEGICRRLRSCCPTLRAVLLSAEEFTNQFVAALRGGNLPSFRKKYRGVDVLLVDDAHFLSSKRATQEEFLHTFKCLEKRGGQVVITADSHPRLADWASEELASRLASGMLCPLEALDFDTRLRIVQSKANRLGLLLGGDVLQCIAEYVVSSVRELEGAVKTLRAHSQLMRVSIDRETARRVLSQTFQRPQRILKLADIEQAVCTLFGVEPDRLKSSCRNRDVSQPRMLAMYLARKHTQAAYSEIGRFFGRRNHCTALSAEKKVSSWLGTERILRLRDRSWSVDHVIEMLEQKLRAS